MGFLVFKFLIGCILIFLLWKYMVFLEIVLNISKLGIFCFFKELIIFLAVCVVWVKFFFVR